MKVGEFVMIPGWPSPWAGGRVVSDDGCGRIIERDGGGSFQWTLSTPAIDAGCGATSCTLLAQGNAGCLELAEAALTASMEAEDRRRGRVR